jgi:hypothetical protein
VNKSGLEEDLASTNEQIPSLLHKNSPENQLTLDDSLEQHIFLKKTETIGSPPPRVQKILQKKNLTEQHWDNYLEEKKNVNSYPGVGFHESFQIDESMEAKRFETEYERGEQRIRERPYKSVDYRFKGDEMPKMNFMAGKVQTKKGVQVEPYQVIPESLSAIDKTDPDHVSHRSLSSFLPDAPIDQIERYTPPGD